MDRSRRLSGRTLGTVLEAVSDEPPPGGTAAVNFNVSGTYLDRSRDNEYPIITEWLQH
jgi:hypothetical protein